MGDWSNNLEYEQREHYGHFYDTDEDVHEEEETDDLISKQKVLNTLDFADNALTDEERTVEKYKELLTECIKVLPSGSENIRCKDCKFLKVAGDDIFKEHMCGSWVVATDLNFGCVLAERAEE